MPATTHPRVRGSRNLPSVLDSQTYRPLNSLSTEELRHPTLQHENEILNEKNNLSSTNSKASKRNLARYPSNHTYSVAEQRPNTWIDVNVPQPGRADQKSIDHRTVASELDSGENLNNAFNSAPRPPKHEELPRRMVSNWHTPLCVVCEQGLSAKQRVVRTDYGNIHDKCFECYECHEPLEHSEFYFRDNRLLCHLDYHKLYSERCGYCNTPVESEGLVALDKHWHKGHFFCHDCSTPFSEVDDYFVTNSDVLCESCHVKKLAINCWRCKTVCRRAIEALGRMWCSHCFSCEECKNPFESEEFILREDGTLVCDRCETLRLRRDCWS